MNRTTWIAATVFLTAVALAAGYWWGTSRAAPAAFAVAPGRTATVPAASPAAAAVRKVLYYRNPMGLADTSPVPKKDQMGMDYIAVYADDDAGPVSGPPLVKLSLDKVQKLGVKTEAVALRDLANTLRAVATVQANERLQQTVTSKFDGWIQKLHVNTTGQAVKRGEPLMDVYSPDLITAQNEYLIARRGVNMVAGGGAEVQSEMQRLVDGALQRLRNWDISQTELQRLEHEGKAQQNLTLRSPASGVVLEKPSIQGKRFMAGEVLYQIADLSSVWLLAEVFERDLAQLRLGQPAQVRIDAYPDQVFAGTLTFVYPTVNPETRTAKVRIELANRRALFKPSMYARVEFGSSRNAGKALSVPDSAVLDSGTRQLVLVQRAEGRFEPRPVKLGRRGDGYVEVLEGVMAGEDVVVSANFLIDAESNLKAALGGFGQSAQGARPDDPRAAGTRLETHRGEGRVEAVDAGRSSVTLTHAPIASLKWPAMTIDFKVKEASLLRALKPGQYVAFDMAGEPGGEYTIVGIRPAAGQKPGAATTPADTQRGR